ncbi:unnamed protein product [Trichobilharzia regenti]|nr:unnamed protein product [Trichobilharzia regenti]
MEKYKWERHHKRFVYSFTQDQLTLGSPQGNVGFLTFRVGSFDFMTVRNHPPTTQMVLSLKFITWLTVTLDFGVWIQCRNDVKHFASIFSNFSNSCLIFCRKNGLVGGEMVIGGVNPEYFIGDFENVPVIYDNSWSVIIKSMKINGVGYCKETCIGLLDTGTSLISGSDESVDTINSRLGAKLSGDGEYAFNCKDINLLLPIEFVFKKRSYILEAKNYVLKEANWLYTQCTSPFASNDGISPGVWVLGNVFMRKFYTVFDFGENEIWLAGVNDG